MSQRPNSGVLSQVTQYSPRSPSWLGEVQIERQCEVDVVCKHCGAIDQQRVRVSFLQRLAAWGKHNLSLKLSEPGAYDNPPTDAPACAESRPRQAAPAMRSKPTPPAPVQPDLVNQAGARAPEPDFNDDLPF